jgi:SAM-dependent methyltransferase
MSILSEAFNTFAVPYELARPGYPAPLIERVVEFAGIGADARLLEIGCGTGKATRPFAERGFRILALEPGTNLADVARRGLARFPNVEIATTSFESWRLERRAFDLVFAGQSIHWVAREQRLRTCARAQRRHGTLAIFGNAPDISADPANDSVQEQYRRHAPSLVGRDGARQFYRSPSSPMLAELEASRDFDDVHYEHFRWQRPLTSAAYRELLATYSDHATLPAEQRSALLEGVGHAIDDHGGTITIEYHTGLFLARAKR